MIKSFLKYKGILPALCVGVCLLFSGAQAQFYIKKNTDSSAQDSGGNKSIFIKPQTSRNSTVYKPPVARSPSGSSNAYSGGSALQKKNYSAPSGRSSSGSVKHDPQVGFSSKSLLSRKCTEQENRIYQKMEAMRTKYYDVVQNNIQETRTDDGRVVSTYDKASQEYMDKFSAINDKLLADPVKYRKYNEIAIVCGR